MLCRETYQPAPWCREREHKVEVKQCTVWGAGGNKHSTETRPNNYRITYIDEHNTSDPAFCPVEHGALCGMSTGRHGPPDLSCHMAEISLHKDLSGHYSIDGRR
ncbi:uncharacterized protein LOC101857078 [Aplysia californica]|uniref:Uncharacterized protein LOC101857078 n=1 Tax=Aplysia californica TaxID=6500 RepID=A0ABM0JCF8_APLCA|nr:uncharacterized protein LOC101857078 [Aplysia californica]